MSSSRWADTATLLANGKVLVVGGTTFNTMGTYLASADLYDPADGVFGSTGSLPTPLLAHAATLLDSGKVLITGGWSNPDGPSLTAAQLYDPVAGSFGPAGSMTAGRAGQTATSLATGQVLIVGGAVEDTGPSAELYTP